MFNPKFDPYEMIEALQHQVSALQHTQNQLISIMNSNREVIQALHNSNQRNFEFMLEQAMKVDGLALKLDAELRKKQP